MHLLYLSTATRVILSIIIDKTTKACTCNTPYSNIYISNTHTFVNGQHAHVLKKMLQIHVSTIMGMQFEKVAAKLFYDKLCNRLLNKSISEPL